MSKEIDNDMHKTVSQTDKNRKSPRRIRKRIIALSAAVFLILLGLILFGVWDIYIDPPAWWRSGRQEDKKAILEYVESNYPDTIKRKGGYFPLQMPASGFKDSVMYFELDSVNFSVSAWDGIITSDTYYEAKAEKYIRENYIDDFMNERGLSPKIEISFVSPPGHYGMFGEDVLGDIYSFEGTILVKITQDHIDGVSTPKGIVWFYDFYQYWVENCDLPNCAVYLYYPKNNEYATNGADYHIWFEREEKTFSDENDFYKGFTR